MSAQSKSMFPGLPVLDVQALAAAHGRNLKALAEAGRIVGAGVQAVARRQAEIAQGGLQAVIAEIETVLKAGPKVDVKAALPVGKAREAYVGAVAQAEELVELGGRAAREAYAVLKARSIAQIDELGRLAG